MLSGQRERPKLKTHEKILSNAFGMKKIPSLSIVLELTEVLSKMVQKCRYHFFEIPFINA